MSTRILVVDDSPFARKILLKSLPTDWDVEVTQAGNGQEALDHYQTGAVDVMFLDLTMPGMDGYQVLEELRRRDLNCLVVVVSADIQPEAQDRVRKMGAVAFVKKPVDAHKLQAILRDYGVLV